MSITLPVVDLSSAAVGTSGTIPLQAAGLVAVPSQQPPFLAIFNDSGAGLLITLKKSQQQFYLSAKGHVLIAISNAEGEIAYQVMNISTNIQVNQLWAVYFYPGEQVTDFSALGTSSVSQQATTLVNTGNAANTPIIFAEQAGDTSTSGSVNITNSGLASFGDATSPGKVVVSGPAGTNNIFPTEISIIGAGAENIDMFFVGADAFLNLVTQAGSSILKFGTQSVSVNGQVSGTTTLYQILTGLLKVCIINQNNYQNNATQNLVLPVAFTTRAWVVTTHTDGIDFLSGGVAQTISIQTSLLIGGGAQSPQGFIKQFSQGLVRTGFDTIRMEASAASQSGIHIIVGV